MGQDPSETPVDSAIRDSWFYFSEFLGSHNRTFHCEALWLFQLHHLWPRRCPSRTLKFGRFGAARGALRPFWTNLWWSEGSAPAPVAPVAPVACLSFASAPSISQALMWFWRSIWCPNWKKVSGSFGATWVPTPRPLLDSAYDLPVEDQLTFCITLAIFWCRPRRVATSTVSRCRRHGTTATWPRWGVLGFTVPMKLEDLEFGDLPHLATKKHWFNNTLAQSGESLDAWQLLECKNKKNMLCWRPFANVLGIWTFLFPSFPDSCGGSEEVSEAYLPMTSSRAKRQAARLQTSKSEPARFAHWKPLVFGRIRNLWGALFVLVCCFVCFRICIWGVLDHTATTQVWQVRFL